MAVHKLRFQLEFASSSAEPAVASKKPTFFPRIRSPKEAREEVGWSMTVVPGFVLVKLSIIWRYSNLEKFPVLFNSSAHFQ